MNKAQLLKIYDEEQRRDVIYPGVKRQVLPHVIRQVDKNGAMNQVLFTDLDENNADAAIKEQMEFFAGQEFEWKYFTHDNPPDLKARLANHGFAVGDEEAIMILDLEDVPEILSLPVTHDIRRIADPDAIAGIMTVQEQVFADGETDPDENWIVKQLAKELRETPEQLSIYAVYAEDGTTVGSSAWVLFPENNRFASLWGAATLPQHRKKGFYTALLATRVQEAQKRGRRFMTVDASPMSRPILTRFGFQWITSSHPCTIQSKNS